jgi:hypothetical protein
MTTEAEKTRETRLRRMAKRQGLRLMKSRVRDPRALDYGRWYVVEPYTNAVVAGDPGYMGLDDVERYLMEGDADARRERRRRELGDTIDRARRRR